MTTTDILSELWQVINDRFENPSPRSYVSQLVSGEKGSDRVLEKIGEEATEFIIAAKNQDPSRVVSEAADLQFHLMVALRVSGVSFQDVLNELSSRRK
ncbi:MAG: phosphoribosyl-ATP diphosphatase [Methanoregulaceae archaeon]|jgi:phosphoribosyl-ATP pyrophosphohydrolase|nr:phosphoribosyl-ATP diphosphatase [Methanoregulaceae archaeon]MCU0627959.1 phosphoribosyl-ATP diphosphatase [Methanoregulaceae archaeon]